MADRGRIAAALEYLSSNPVVQAMKGFGSAQGEQMQQMQDAFLSANPITRPFVAGTERDVLGNTFRGGQQIGQSLVNDPGALANALKGEFADAVKGIQSPYGAGRVVGNLFSPMEVASGLKSLAKPVMQEITVYHGTPHRFPATESNPLGEFDASKIGTGEGAQAYGHGIYVAESPDVAQEYRNRLSTNVTVDGSKLQSIPSDSPLAEAHNMVVRNIQSGMAPEAAISATRKYWIDAAEEMKAFAKNNPELAERIAKESESRMKVAEAASSLKPQSFYRDPGSLYHVDLPDPMIEKMLDWDKPLSEQPENVRKALESHPAIVAEIARRNEKRILLNEQSPGRLTHPVIGKLAGKEAVANDLKGSELYQTLSNYFRDEDSAWNSLGITPNDAKNIHDASSRYAAKLGIPGIRYLDAGSRGATDTGRWELKFKDGTSKVFDFKPNDDVLASMGATASPIGTRNFVIFPGEEKNLKILERK